MHSGFHGDDENHQKKDVVDTASIREKVKLARSEKWRILKNIIVVSVAFMVQFTAFQGTANLQSSINSKDSLGTISLAAIYGSLVVSCIFLPTLLIRKFTVKWALFFSMLCYAPYIGAQFYPKFYTLIPAGILVGLGAAPMWASKATYLTQLGQVYAKLTEQSVEAIIVRFFGFFFLAWQSAELWGNLISSLVLSSGAHGGGGSGASNYSDDELDLCGANFCVEELHDNANLQRPPDSEIFEISIIYLTCIGVAVAIIAIFMDPLSRYGERRRGSVSAQETSGIQLLAATFRQMKKPNQQLLIPLTVFIGIEQAFIGADFTQAYVSCALGIHQIGYVMIVFGVVNAICSIIFGTIMKYTGRFVIIIFGTVVHMGIFTYILFWRPHPDHKFVFFLISGLWGVSDAVWQTQINGIYGALFRRNKEAAFSNYRLWESVGFVIAYVYSTLICTSMKLYIVITVLAVGTICYIIVEIRHLRKERKQKELEKKLEQPNNQLPIEPTRRIDDETDDEKDELEEDIVVTHL
ncbi:UNC93-like protein [Chironomus tepperi]|uniref:UNC93-like protein n=1 Tax=Chironomus tepperi TaxID=113505 RepID=UPI00391F5B9C